MENTIGQRIQQLREAKQLSVADFAKAAGVKPTAIYGLERGDNKPSYDVLLRLGKHFPDLNPDWLLLGTGPMLRDDRTLTPVPPTQSIDTAGPEPPQANQRSQVVEHADTVLKLASAEAENQQLRERLDDAKEEILWLRGKSRTSPDAAVPTTLAPLPAPNAIGYHACAERRAAEFEEYVAVRQEEGGVAELV